jgi:hypothetical protein
MFARVPADGNGKLAQAAAFFAIPGLTWRFFRHNASDLPTI